MNNDGIKTAYDEKLATIGQALSHPIRIQILRLLARGERCGCEIAPYFKLDQSGVSRHLTALRRAGLVASRRDGVRIYWRLAGAHVHDLIAAAERIITEET